MPALLLLKAARPLLVLTLAAVVFGATARGVASQSPTSHPSVQEARRLRDEGSYPAAIALLQRHLGQQPRDSEAARLLAQTLYWQGERDAALIAYEAALRQHPADAQLRLEFARMLAETDRRGRAREVVAPLTRRDRTRATPGVDRSPEGAARASAEALLGTIAHWSGDPAGARRHFQTALAIDPRHDEATRGLTEIHAATAPWARLAAAGRRDAPPHDRAAALVELGWYASPLHAFALQAEPQYYSASRKGTSLTSAEARLGSAWPAVGMTSEVAVGGVWRETGTEWTGRGELGLRLPLHLLARLKAERAPYLWTVASLETPVMTETGTALLTWSDPRGWSGEAAASVQRYADGNRVRSSYAWFLAPVIRAPSGGVEIGYGVSVQDADQLRYALPTRASDGTLIPARYDPYFTPIATQAHSLAAAAGWKGGRAAVRAGGAYGFSAREDAPFAIVGSPQPGLVTRSFHPWNLRARLDVPLSRGVTATAGTELFATAFYSYRALDLGLFVRFLGSAAREPR